MATAMNVKTDRFADLRKRLIFLLLALLVYRVGAHIPVPGIDPEQLATLFDSQSGGILGLFNMFSGGCAVALLLFLRSASCPTSLHRSSCS